MSLGDFLQGVADVAQTAITTLPQIIAANQAGGAIPGPFPGVPSLSLSPGAIAGVGAAAAAGVGGCPQFVATRTRLRAVPELRAINPSTQKIESWTHRGSPIIWSGDRAIAKKYAKAAGFTLRRRGSTARPRRAASRKR